MDIPVSRLNERLAVQLPAELPLGLVFVVGRVDELTLPADGRALRRHFHIVDGEHRLRCRAADRALGALELSEGDRIRAGGHLAFDPRSAAYYLLARDIEVLPEQSASSSALAAIIADIDSRAQAANLAPAELPEWVKRMAPAGLPLQQTTGVDEREEEPVEPADGREASSALTITGLGALALQADERVHSDTTRLPDQASLSDENVEMVQFLSEAMDSPEEVELTKELLAKFDPTAYLDQEATAELPPSPPETLADQPVEPPAVAVPVEAIQDETTQEAPGVTLASRGRQGWFEQLPWYVIVLAVMAFFGLLAALFILGLLLNVIPFPG